MYRKLRNGSIALATAAVLTPATGGAAHADDIAPQADVYVSDRCSSTNNNRCFVLLHNSHRGGLYYSACFIANRNIRNYAGYYRGDGITAHYVFANRNKQWFHTIVGCAGGNGDGKPVKNNAAGGANALRSYAYRVYHNSGYGGVYNTFRPGKYKNLSSALKNDNASGKVLR